MKEKKTCEEREQRLAKALRANLQRRKAQARRRRELPDEDHPATEEKTEDRG